MAKTKIGCACCPMLPDVRKKVVLFKLSQNSSASFDKSSRKKSKIMCRISV
jgi:hypothetical protein